MPARFLIACLTACLLSVTASAAQDRRPSHCIALANAVPGIAVLHNAAFRDPVPQYTVRLRYIAHAMFLLEEPGGLSVVTDYTGFLGPTGFFPNVATMNRAHGSHWTTAPDPRIPHVLPGWNPEGGPADHHLDLGSLLVRSVSTDIRSDGPGGGQDGNSIFVFEVEGLCIGHLGHLHHEPTPEQYVALGRLDVVMAPVDGGMTVPLPMMIRILKRLQSSVVIPMHWFGRGTLAAFLAGMADEFVIDETGASSVEVSLRTLPDRPTVVVLDPTYLQDDD
ncbi:MBL fold metallo-hydrolase [Pseudoruegeria sp. SK021]|uniref:MBL fold metallo-hydrolase n=1 Tax=Pseudoruegeria sp. SK021 TaxID=1933035 RepID=UPI000A25C4E0|nr:MBL fold metallo-hydrolase [Pseudoruegeria sp. SK021]OSP56512.1 Zn-dependent hydrolase [Pseudoruegeria sp. SK021]